ncbi:MAG: cell wall-binding repeat-containing protein [Candidatus Andersenbacteria bacterium]
MYTCPMHPQIRQNHPGTCPICGMALVREGAAQTKRTIKDFLPLIVIFAVIFGLTALFSGLHEGNSAAGFDWLYAMRFFEAFFFITFSAFKLLNLKGFVEAYQTYDLLAKRSRAYAYAYPFIELLLGAAYLFNQFVPVVAAITLLLMLIGAIGVARELRKKRQINCACLGVVFKLPMTWVTFIEDIVMAVMAAIMLVASIAPTPRASAQTVEDLVRVAGANRYETSVAVSQQLFPAADSTDGVVLSTGLNFADALAGVTLAHRIDAPLMLIEPHQIPATVWDELQRVLPEDTERVVYLLGGTNAIDANQEAVIQDHGYDVVRIEGSDRISTALALADVEKAQRGSAPETYYLVNGYRFPDALSIAPRAAIDGDQVLLTGSSSLDSRTLSYLLNNRPLSGVVTIIGGDAVVPETFATQLRAQGFTVNRIYGPTRYATSRAVADTFVDVNAGEPSTIGVASGENFPDALAAAVHLAEQNAPLLLEKKDLFFTGCIETSDYIQDHEATIADGFLYGGTAVFTTEDEDMLDGAIQGTVPFNCETTIAGCQIFPSDSVWNSNISAYPVHPNSANYINSIMSGRQFLHADFGSNPDYGIPITVVPSSQPLVPMSFDVPSESDPGPYPFPANAKVEVGSDHHVLVVQQGACDLYETFDSTFTNPGWHAFAGAKFDLTTGTQRPDYWTSADAAGLPIMPGLVRYDEVASGSINHALRFTVSESQRAFIHPATHYASSDTSSNVPPMGLRLRLKASFDTSPYYGQARVILEALKKHGMFVADNGSDWFISGETDSRWNDTDLDQLKGISGNNFEAIDTGPLIF